MKKIFGLFILLISAGAFAAPTKPAAPTPIHPVTSSTTVHMPRTNVVVQRPQTTVKVTPPKTQEKIVRPETPGAVVHSVSSYTNAAPETAAPAAPAAPKATVPAPAPAKTADSSSKSSYNASYKNAKDLSGSKPPVAASLVQGEKGMGMANASQAAARESLASQEQAKGEDAQVAAQDVLKNTNLPPEVKEALNKLKSNPLFGKKK